jgi:hypothetical protein
LKVTTPPVWTAASSAAAVQLAALPSPTTVVGLETSAGPAAFGGVQLLPGAGGAPAAPAVPLAPAPTAPGAPGEDWQFATSAASKMLAVPGKAWVFVCNQRVNMGPPGPSARAIVPFSDWRRHGGLQARPSGISLSREMINPLDTQALRARWTAAEPFPHVIIDDFLERAAAEEVALSYPSFAQANVDGFAFNFVNEQRKVQVTDASRFPEPVRRLNEAIASSGFLAQLEAVTGIPRLVADEKLVGGGMHLTGSGGRLDVHVDFNLIEDRKLFRRLNILVYLNPIWNPEWGGDIELWDRDVKMCHRRCTPALNRCLIFETSDISFHGVTAVTAPADVVRQSFAAYYYTREAPPHWNGRSHSTIFRARPDEKFRRFVSMPAESLRRRVQSQVKRSRELIKALIGSK